jgi:putative (di)nucleoside polyphosphate hydrolase
VKEQKQLRRGVTIVLVNNKNELLWAKRIGQQGWQFPQGGIHSSETPVEAMYRELYEEVGLSPGDVVVLSSTQKWLTYYLPKRLLRHHMKPLCIGQTQRWFLLRFSGEDSKICFNKTSKPEFDDFKWVPFWQPLDEIIFFKKSIYKKALTEFYPVIHSSELQS